MRILMILIAVILLGSILGIIHKVKQERAQQTVSDSSWDITDKKYVDQRPELDVELLPVNEYSRPGLALKKVRGIVVHYTANPGTTAIQNRNYFAGLEQSHQTKASSHFVIGLDGEIVQCIPCNEIAYASMSLYTNDTDTLRQMISQAIPQALMSFFTIIVTFISMLVLSPLLTLLAIVVIGILVFVTKKIGGNSGKYFVRQQVSLADVTGFVEEHMNGQRVVKVFNHEQKSKEEFDQLNEALFDSASQANKYANMMGPVIGNIGNLQFVLTAVLGGVLSVAGVGGITLGVMASYLQFTKSFTQPFMQVAQQFNSIVMALAGAERIFALIDEKPETDEGYVTLVNAKRDADGNIIECKERTGMWAWKHPHSADGSVSYTPLTGDVRFEDVTFGYNPNKVILKDISLFAKPGQKLAFVGSTGAGKTTITNLINRFYDIQEGKIRYDGINITKIKKDDLRRSLGIVLQDTHLFTGTIRDNIRYGNLDATDEQIYEAARLAHADQFIRMLPNGYDTMLSGDGEELSQGQRQLLSIARAAVADPPVLILDEATSSIDTRTESIVQKGMDNLMKGRTVFVIAHRLSTIRNSDAIIVLDHGQIIERGDHADLIKQKGTYYQLYTGKLELS